MRRHHRRTCWSVQIPLRARTRRSFFLNAPTKKERDARSPPLPSRIPLTFLSRLAPPLSDTCIRPTEMHGAHDQNDERRERTRVPTPSPAWPLRPRHCWVFKNGASFFPRFSTSGCERASFFLKFRLATPPPLPRVRAQSAVSHPLYLIVKREQVTCRFCFSEFPVSVVAVGFLMKREEREKKDPLSFSLPSQSLSILKRIG